MQTDGVLASPKPIVATIGYGDYSIRYRLIYNTAERDRLSVKNELVTRIWYMAKRHGFTMPYPVHVAAAAPAGAALQCGAARGRGHAEPVPGPSGNHS